jgi:hypothetical protein
MNLPDFFIADLPASAALTPAMLDEACQTLKRNRERYLLPRSTRSVIHVLSHVAAEWLKPEFSFRKIALTEGPAATGFSRATLESGLDNFFKSLTSHALEALVEQDLGHGERLDQVVASVPEQKSNRAALAVAPELLVHIAAGNVPNPALMSIVLGLLARSAQFVKCASGTGLLPRLFAHSIHEAEPKLAACLELAEWKGGNEALESVLFEHAECVSATGSDETLVELRRRMPARVRFLGYGARVSFAYVAHELLTGLHGKKIVDRAVRDVSAWNQLGCLSPHVIYVQTGGVMTPEQFAEALAGALAERELTDPRGEIPVETAATIASRRSIYQLRAAHSPDTQLWCSKESTAWTVVYESDPRFQISCLNRFIYVKGVADLTHALQSADAIRGKVSTVGLAVAEHKGQEMAIELARWGTTRVCPLGQMQNPPLAWRHDGRPTLADLVTWTDWEQ